MRKSILFIVAFVVVVSIGLLAVDGRQYGSFAAPYIQSAASKAGVAVTIKNPRLHLYGLKADQAAVNLSRILLGLDITSLNVQPSYAALFGRRLSANFTGNLYKGIAEGRISIDQNGTISIGSFQLNGVELSEHPVLTGFAVSGGTLDLSASDFAIERGKLQAGRLELQIKGLETESDTHLPGKLIGSPIDVVIPQVSDLNLYTSAELTANHLFIRDISLESSLIEAEGDVSVVFGSEAHADTVAGTIDIKLSNDGHKVLGAWLPLLSEGALNDQVKEFTAIISGAAARPRFTFVKTPVKSVPLPTLARE